MRARRLPLPILLLILAACQTGGSLVNPHLALEGVYTRQVLISDHPHYVLMGHVIITRHNGEEVRALVIQQRRDGVHRLRFQDAWADGMRLPYRSSMRGPGCTHGHCRDNPVGMILLSAPLFEHATRHGLQARLTGRSGAVTIAAPARLFRDATDLANRR